MKVVICSDYFYPTIGGVTTHIENLAINLEKNGHEVVIITKGARLNGSRSKNGNSSNKNREFTNNEWSRENGGKNRNDNGNRNEIRNKNGALNRSSFKMLPGIVNGLGLGIVNGIWLGAAKGTGSEIGIIPKNNKGNENQHGNGCKNGNIIPNGNEITNKNRIDVTKIESDFEGIEVIRLNSFFRVTKSLEVPHTRELEKIFRRIDPDVIHAHHAFSPVSLLSLSVGKKLGIKSILTTHSIQFFYDYDYIWMPSSYILFPYRRYINNADKIVAVSKAAASFISHFTNKDVSIIPNGVNVKEIAPQTKNYEGKNLLFVGRFVYRKGLHLLLQAMEDVVKEDKEAKLTIVGKGYFNHIIKLLIRALDLQKNVIIKEGLSRGELIKEYQASNVFMMPSIFGESFGIVLLEAMASKTPIVASNQGGIKEIIKHEQTGILVEKNKVKEMSENILRLINDKEYSKRLSSNAYKEVKKYDWSKVTREIENIYNS